MNDLPDEIQHIAEGFFPLNTLLSRLAQQTHNQLADEIIALAKMPVPSASVNGNAASSDDDTSPENLNKKVRLLNFVQERHGEWVKALVITNWSRKAEPVSKLIDLMHHINKTRTLYQAALDYMINIKRDLTYARLPNPDLRTALHILSTGQAPWMPELNYIEPPPLTLKDQMQAIENLNTLLSMRLNLEDHENIPQQFQDYKIDSGRVTFRVHGEFEVDLTIADEDVTKQFWFIDFRLDFTPAPRQLSEILRGILENKVNDALQRDGLHGCYKFLHEFVLTHKITEYVRQAIELAKGRWVDMLKVERLNRAMSIQYWSGLTPAHGLKSWIILGVSSGTQSRLASDRGSSSRLTLRWFRDGKEVTDVQIPLERDTISAEGLLRGVIGRHIDHILRSIHQGLAAKGRFINHKASLKLNIAADKPGESELTMQLGQDSYTHVKIALYTGMITLCPQSNVMRQWQERLNTQARHSATDQILLLDGLRCHYVMDDLRRRGKSMGWTICNPAPVKADETRTFLNSREQNTTMWLKRRGLPDQWYILANQSLSGDQWWLTQVANRSDGSKIINSSRLPLTTSVLKFSDRLFSDLTVFSATMVSQLTLVERMHKEKIKYLAQKRNSTILLTSINLPSIYISLSDILRRPHSHGSATKAPSWAYDFVQIEFKGIENPKSKASEEKSSLRSLNGGETASSSTVKQQCFNIVVDARVKVADPSRFGALRGNVERDLAFNERQGVFAFKIESEIGSPVLDTLAHRLQALSRLAGSIDAIRQCGRDVKCDEIKLNQVKFSYTDKERPIQDAPRQAPHRWIASLDLRTNDLKLRLDSGNPQARLSEQLHRLINSKEGFKAVPWYLSVTLPIQRALDSIEDGWEALTMNDQGRADVTVAHLDWYILQFALGPARNIRGKASIHIRLKTHEDAPTWHIYREELGASKHPDDEFQKALQKVWASEYKLGRSFQNGVALASGDDAEALIKGIDEVTRPLAIRSPAATKQTQPKPPSVAAKHMGQNKNMNLNKVRPQAAPVVISLDD
ncbi:mediator complex subunit MED14 [Xylariaceae sp. FL0255]|nr:mediator complex subunit MED14 [Xylariaceae sp. FL0255]